MIDMHCHILPGLDDGPETLEESLETARLAVRQGINGIVATPHFHPGRYLVDAKRNHEKRNEFIKACEEQKIPITIYPGQECYYYSELVKELDAGNALTIGNSRYVLLEFDTDVSWSLMQAGIRDLRNYGYYTILAHFERYDCLRKMERIMELKEQNVLLQMNYDTVLMKDSIFQRKPWKKMVLNDMVDLLGSDCHGMGFRPLQADRTAAWLQKKADPAMMNGLLQNTIRKILEV